MNRGQHAAIIDFVRTPSTSVDPIVKNYHWLDLVKGLYAAYEQGAETAILVDTNKNIAEGPGSNVFAIKNGKISTPESGVLMGITCQTIFELSAGMQINCAARDVSSDDLKAADEVFITSTAGEVMPVTKIDGVSVGTGDVGPLTKEITEAYWRMHGEARFRTEITYPESHCVDADV